MKQIFKNAIVYKAHLPSLETMQRTLDDQVDESDDDDDWDDAEDEDHI